MSKQDKEKGVARGAGCILRGERGNGGIETYAISTVFLIPAHAPSRDAGPGTRAGPPLPPPGAAGPRPAPQPAARRARPGDEAIESQRLPASTPAGRTPGRQTWR